MTSRRKFIQRAGLLAGAGIVHQVASADPLQPDLSGSLPERIRRQLLIPSGKTYLNTGSLGPSPKPVLDAVMEAMWTLEKDPVSENWGKLGLQMEEVRKKVADFIHADTSEVLLTRNTTEGLSLVCQVLPLKPGDEILTTTLEHGGGEVGLEYLTKAKGAVLRKVELPLPPKNAGEIVSAIERALTPATKVVMLSHVNTITGVLMPLSDISRITSSRGIFLLVDGAQAPGLTPVDVNAMGADAYASSGHKWLLGPKETGFLYVSKKFQPAVPPVFTMYGFNAYTQASGTRNVALMIGLGKAIDWHTQLGITTVADYTLSLRNYCLQGLSKVQGLRIISPEEPSISTGIVSFELLSQKNTNVYERLKERNIIVKVLPQHNAIRISCHIFVSQEDIDLFLGELKRVI